MKYSVVSFASTSRRRTTAPTETTLVSTRRLSMTWAFARRSSSCAMRCSSIICSFFASSYSAFSAISPNSRAAAMRSAISRRFVVRSTSSSAFSCL